MDRRSDSDEDAEVSHATIGSLLLPAAMTTVPFLRRFTPTSLGITATPNKESLKH